MRQGLAVVLFSALLALPAYAQDDPAPAPPAPSEPSPIYAWVDGRGAWYFVDSITLVPPLYRDQALRNTRSRDAWNNQVPVEPEFERRVHHTGSRARQERPVAPLPEPVSEPTETTSTPEPKGAPPKASSRAADVDSILTRIRNLKTERTRAEEQLARLEEGRPPTDDAKDADLSEKDLLARVEQLDGRLIGIEHEIARLQAEIGGPMGGD